MIKWLNGQIFGHWLLEFVISLHSPVEEIKNRLDIVEVISGYIKLQKAGRNFRARCPFHSEKTPSFMVSSERQIWHCFGCGKGGDIFGFVKEIEGVEFVDALRTLAQRAGVVLKKQDPKIQSERQRLYEICELATKFFQKQLNDSVVGKQIQKYLLERGINSQSIKEWRLGYAPDGWEALSKFLKSRGYSDKEIIASGVVVERDESFKFHVSSFKFYDRFRNRIIFPIADINGQVVGFAGRVAPGGDEKSAKYVNTPQTLIYDKGRILYGLDKAKIEIKKNNFSVLVEGNTDVIMSYQAGVKNVIASSGTALTEDHLKIIKRYADNLVLAFDVDLAGANATKRTANLALSQGFNVKIIVAPSGKKIKDPADLIRENPRAWEKAVASARGIVEFCLADALARHDAKTAVGKKQIAKELLPVIKRIVDPIEQAHWVGELAKKLRVSEKILSEALAKASAPKEEFQKIAQPAKKPEQAKSRRLRLEEELLSVIIGAASPKETMNEIIKWREKNKIENVFQAEHTENIFKNLAQHLQKSQNADKINLSRMQGGLLPEQAIYLNQIILIAEIRQIDPKKHSEHVNFCLVSMKKEIIREKMEKLQYEIKNREDKNDKKKISDLLAKFKSLAQQLIS